MGNSTEQICSGGGLLNLNELELVSSGTNRPDQEVEEPLSPSALFIRRFSLDGKEEEAPAPLLTSPAHIRACPALPRVPVLLLLEPLSSPCSLPSPGSSFGGRGQEAMDSNSST